MASETNKTIPEISVSFSPNPVSQKSVWLNYLRVNDFNLETRYTRYAHVHYILVHYPTFRNTRCLRHKDWPLALTNTRHVSVGNPWRRIIKKVEDEEHIDDSEIRCWRRMLRVPWTNASAIENIKMKQRLSAGDRQKSFVFLVTRYTETKYPYIQQKVKTLMWTLE